MGTIFRFILLCCLLFYSVSLDQAFSDIHWILLHYHKTGHDIVDKFIKTLSSFNCNFHLCSKHEDHSIKKRSIVTRSKIKTCPLSLLQGSILPFDWNASTGDDIDNHFHDFRLVHFVRDPYDMIISGYFYHSEVPPPVSEKWLLDPNYNLCQLQTNPPPHWEDIASILGNFYGNTTYIKQLILMAFSLCQQLQKQYANHPKTTYHQLLLSSQIKKSLPRLHSDINATSSDHIAVTNPFDGLRLEALRSLISGDVRAPGGDILRMAVNVLFERRGLREGEALVPLQTLQGSPPPSPPSGCSSLRVFLSQFPLGNLTQFQLTTQSIYRFLLRPARTYSPSLNHFMNCLSQKSLSPETVSTSKPFDSSYDSLLEQAVANAVNKTISLGFVPLSSISSNPHFTSGKITPEKKLEYIQRLDEDPIIGPLLRISSQALYL